MIYYNLYIDAAHEVRCKSWITRERQEYRKGGREGDRHGESE